MTISMPLTIAASSLSAARIQETHDGSAAHLRATAPQIMGGDSGNPRRLRVWLEELPHDFLGHSLPLGLVRAVHWTQHVALGQLSRRSPRIYCNLHPVRHRNGTHATVLPDQVHD